MEPFGGSSGPISPVVPPTPPPQNQAWGGGWRTKEGQEVLRGRAGSYPQWQQCLGQEEAI